MFPLDRITDEVMEVTELGSLLWATLLGSGVEWMGGDQWADG